MDWSQYENEIESSLQVSNLHFVDIRENHIEIETAIVRLIIEFDKRDGILNSYIFPLDIEADIADKLPVWILLRMLGYMDDDEELRTHPLGDMSREISNIGVVMREIFLKDARVVRDALFFANGYSTGFMDCKDRRPR